MPGEGQSVSKTAREKFIYGKNRDAVKKEKKKILPFERGDGKAGID